MLYRAEMRSKKIMSFWQVLLKQNSITAVNFAGFLHSEKPMCFNIFLSSLFNASSAPSNVHWTIQMNVLDIWKSDQTKGARQSWSCSMEYSSFIYTVFTEHRLWIMRYISLAYRRRWLWRPKAPQSRRSVMSVLSCWFSVSVCFFLNRLTRPGSFISVTLYTKAVCYSVNRLLDAKGCRLFTLKLICIYSTSNLKIGTFLSIYFWNYFDPVYTAAEMAQTCFTFKNRMVLQCPDSEITPRQVVTLPTKTLH